MTLDKNTIEDKTQKWLQQLALGLDKSPDLVDAMPIEEVREELTASGMDIKHLHSRLARTIALTKIQHLGITLIKWASPIWQPQWAGQAVSAGDIPPQDHTFPIPHGFIDIRCAWQPEHESIPAYIELSWKVNGMMEGELWCQFIQEETQIVFSEIQLGTETEGGIYQTTDDLAFDPSTEEWAISVLIKDSASSEDREEKEEV